MTPAEASRFLAQASLGADFAEIQRTARIGPNAWLSEQFARPIGAHQPPFDERLRRGLEVSSEQRRWSWWQQVMAGPDPLRQMVALAHSEIFVVSDHSDAVAGNPVSAANYYDMLLRNAFGNYRDLLRDVSLHPVMGAYLSHLRNDKSDPRSGRYPDENCAREIMQLLSIGLFQLKQDGTLLPDGRGNARRFRAEAAQPADRLQLLPSGPPAHGAHRQRGPLRPRVPDRQRADRRRSPWARAHFGPPPTPASRQARRDSRVRGEQPPSAGGRRGTRRGPPSGSTSAHDTDASEVRVSGRNARTGDGGRVIPGGLEVGTFLGTTPGRSPSWVAAMEVLIHLLGERARVDECGPCTADYDF